VRVVTIIQSDLSKIISRGFRRDGIVPFPSRDGERNDTARMVNASFACASGEPILAAHATIAVWPKGGEPWPKWHETAAAARDTDSPEGTRVRAASRSLDALDGRRCEMCVAWFQRSRVRLIPPASVLN
jgi:hypothetical protein